MELSRVRLEDSAHEFPDTGLDEMSWARSVGPHPVTMVAVEQLVIEGSPRSAGEDPDHVRLLAESPDALPPIIVHKPTMRVIDGVHRVRAAMLNGSPEISARLLDCDENVAFVLGVKANVTHGLPLSHADRAAAAARIIVRNPQWSDRAVAASVGLSGKTVSRIRAGSTADTPQSNARLGRDGRLRPLDVGSRRRQAAELIHQRPEAGLREVAQATGLSAATVRDVRLRLNRGEDPVPAKYRAATYGQDADGSLPPAIGPRPVPESARPRPAHIPVDLTALLRKLRGDPSLRFSEAGRFSLRWLHQHTVDADGLENVGRLLPDHCAPVVASLARGCAAEWTRLAERLEGRTT